MYPETCNLDSKMKKNNWKSWYENVSFVCYKAFFIYFRSFFHLREPYWILRNTGYLNLGSWFPYMDTMKFIWNLITFLLLFLMGLCMTNVQINAVRYEFQTIFTGEQMNEPTTKCWLRINKQTHLTHAMWCWYCRLCTRFSVGENSIS